MTDGNASKWVWLLKRLGILPTEAAAALAVSAVFFGVQASQAFSGNGADALFFARFGVEFLPQMYMAIGVIGIAVLIGYSAGIAGIRRLIFYPAVVAGFAALLCLLWLAILLDARWVYVAVWLSVNIGAIVLATLAWNVAADTADARSAKRLYPVFASAGIAGGVLGNLLTGPIAGAFGTEGLLLAAAATVLPTAFIARRASSLSPARARPTSSLLVELTKGVVLVKNSKLLRLLAVVAALGSVLFFSLVFAFSTIVASSFETETEIAAFLGLFAAAATAVTFVVSVAVTKKLLARIGVVLALGLSAVVYVLGFSIWLISFTLVTAAVVRFVAWVTGAAVEGTARTAIYNVIRPDHRGSVIAFMAAVPLQVGIFFGGAALWVTQRWLSPTQTNIAALAAAVLFAALIWAMRRQYVDSLIVSLRAGLYEPDTAAHAGVVQFETAAEAVGASITGLTDPHAGVRRISAEMLGRLGDSSVSSRLQSLLEDTDLDVRMTALEAMQQLGAGDIVGAGAVDGQALDLRRVFDVPADDLTPGTRARAVVWLLESGDEAGAASQLAVLLGSESPTARAAGLRVMTQRRWCLDQQQVVDLLAEDPSATVRGAAAAALGATAGGVPELAAAFSDVNADVRRAAAVAWRASGGPPEPLLELLQTGLPYTWENALMGLEHEASNVADRLQIWGTERLGEFMTIRQHRASLEQGVDRSMPAGSWLAWMARQREANSRRIAVRILGVLQAPESVELIIAGLVSSDVEVRAQALEAVDSLGGTLARSIVPLLENEPAESPPVFSVLTDLIDNDFDPWVRALALRCIREMIAIEWRDVVFAAGSDDSDLVREMAAETWAIIGGDMVETSDTLGRMDRLLLLRRVSVFAALWPDPLERLAVAASERLFDDGQPVFLAGDVGDEMVVVVMGEIEVRAAGTDRIIETVPPGGVVGALSMLRETPRSTDAYAVGPVRVLALGAHGVNEIMNDNPEVARAMLRSLADRLANIVESLPIHEAEAHSGDSGTS